MKKDSERWKFIDGYENSYLVSTFGNIVSLYPTEKLGPIVLKPTVGKIGYPYVTLCKGKKDLKKFTVHRIVALNFIGNPDGKPCVNHKDLIRENNHVKNLEWCTYKENANHWIDKAKKMNAKIRSPRAKLGIEDVIKIKSLASRGYKNYQIADMFNITKSMVHQIKYKKSWGHVEDI